MLVEALRELPAQLQAAVTSPEVEQLLRDAAAKLRALADRLAPRPPPDDTGPTD